MTASNNQISYAEFEITVPPGGTVPVERQGDFVSCLSATSDFKIRLNNSPAAFFTAGLTVSPIGGLADVQVVNEGATSLTVTLAIGRGEFKDSRVTLNPTQTLPVRDGQPDLITPTYWSQLVANTATKLLSANPLRKEVIINNTTSGVAGPIAIASTNGVAMHNGILLDAGATIVLGTTAAIWVISQNTPYVQATELEWSS